MKLEKKIPKTPEECSGSGAGLAKGRRKEAVAPSSKGRCMDLYC